MVPLPALLLLAIGFWPAFTQRHLCSIKPISSVIAPPRAQLHLAPTGAHQITWHTFVCISSLLSPCQHIIFSFSFIFLPQVLHVKLLFHLLIIMPLPALKFKITPLRLRAQFIVAQPRLRAKVYRCAFEVGLSSSLLHCCGAALYLKSCCQGCTLSLLSRCQGRVLKFIIALSRPRSQVHCCAIAVARSVQSCAIGVARSIYCPVAKDSR